MQNQFRYTGGNATNTKNNNNYLLQKAKCVNTDGDITL